MAEQVAINIDGWRMHDFMQIYTAWANAKRIYVDEPLKIVSDIQGLIQFTYYEVEKINRCKDSVVVIDCLNEGWAVSDSFRQYDPTKHYVFFSCADWNEQDPAFKLPFDYTVCYFPSWFFTTVELFTSNKSELYYMNNEYDFVYPKPYSFCMLANSIRWHRDYLVENLLPKMQVKHIFKYASVDYGSATSEVDFVYSSPEKNVQYTVEQLEYSFAHTKDHHVKAVTAVPDKLFNQCRFHLVSTGYFKQGTVLIDEKIVKTLVSGIPFVLAGDAGALEYLHSLGFRTYGELWNEDYDDIQDNEKRLNRVIDLCIELQNFDWQAKKDKLQAIAQHNKLRLFNCKDIIDKLLLNIEDKLLALQ